MFRLILLGLLGYSLCLARDVPLHGGTTLSLSLNLPYTICYPLARIARRFAPPRAETCDDQAAYFDHQYDSTQRMHERFMRILLRGVRRA